MDRATGKHRDWWPQTKTIKNPDETQFLSPAQEQVLAKTWSSYCGRSFTGRLWKPVQGGFEKELIHCGLRNDHYKNNSYPPEVLKFKWLLHRILLQSRAKKIYTKDIIIICWYQKTINYWRGRRVDGSIE